MQNASEEDFDFILKNYESAPGNQEKVQETMNFANYLAIVKNADNIKKGVNAILNFRNEIPQQYQKYVDPTIKQAFDKVSAATKAEGNTDLAKYIDGLLK